MKKQIYDEKNGLNYTLHGDYYLPDLEINRGRTYIWEVWNNAKTVSEGAPECKVSVSGTDRETDGAFKSG